ncbi:MAG: DUF3800 domain-containing protein [Limisphaerales bacterium]
MYFFYIDESGSTDPEVSGKHGDGTAFAKDHLYVLTAVSLFEFKWRNFERAIANLKLELSDNLYRLKGTRYDLAECEVKSTWLRLPKLRAERSPFLHALAAVDLGRLADAFYDQLAPMRMHLFSVVVDKRKLHGHVTHDILFKKAYELLLERIEHYLWEFHPKHQGVIVIDDTGRTANRSLAMKHAFIQREGNQVMRFHHIVEYPMFTDSALSNGIQLADLCGYNVYRAFRNRDFAYPYFAETLDRVYCSQRTSADKLDGLKVWPEDSELVEFARQGWIAHKTKQPTLCSGPEMK